MGKNCTFLMFSNLSMLSQDLTFPEIAFEISEIGFQFKKEDTTQRNGESEPVHVGKEGAWTSKEDDTRYLGGTGCQERLGNHFAN